jgi:hypothetical protein
MVTVRDALVEAMQNVIVPNDETSISPSMPVAYLFVTGSTKQKYGYETTLQLAVGETTQEKLEMLYDDIYAAIGTKVTASDATVFPLVVWDHGQSTLMLDSTWGRRSTLKVVSQDMEV